MSRLNGSALDAVVDRRLWSTGIGASVGAHAAIAAGVLAAAFLPSAPRDMGAPPAMAIQLMPEPSGPVTPPRETPPEPQPRPRPVEEKVQPDIPDMPRVANVPDAVALPPKKALPPTEPRPQASAPPSITNPAPRPVAAAPTVGAPASGSTSTQQNWEGKVLARLEQKKRYPAAAAREGLQDVIHVRITIGRKGRVLDSSIVRSKHLAVLDDAVRDLVRRADPLPPLPDSIAGQQYTITVPIDFFVRN